MKNGKYYLGYRVRSLSNRAFICACVVACLITGGCRSSRNVVQESETIEHNEFNTSEKNESVHSEANDTICQRDTIKGDAVEHGRIDIKRDTAGRPVVILGTLTLTFRLKPRRKNRKRLFHATPFVEQLRGFRFRGFRHQREGGNYAGC